MLRLRPAIRLGGAVGSVPVPEVGDPRLNPGSGENFSLKLKSLGNT